jgi:hypothetical protein
MKTAMLVGLAGAAGLCCFLLVSGLIRLATDEQEGSSTIPSLITIGALVAGLVWILSDALRKGRNGGASSD